MRITLKKLVNAKACLGGKLAFVLVFPFGAKVNRRNLWLARLFKLPVGFLMELLTWEQRQKIYADPVLENIRSWVTCAGWREKLWQKAYDYAIEELLYQELTKKEVTKE